MVISVSLQEESYNIYIERSPAWGNCFISRAVCSS